MKNKLWLVPLFSLVTLALYAADVRDGNWWRDLTPSAKANYATGFFDGVNLGHNFSYWNLAHDKQKQECLIDVRDSFDSFSTKYLTHVTNTQLVDGLDSFYSDYRNRSISIANAVWVVVNSIAGTPQDKLDEMIGNFRKNVSK